jgi:hypothetical protein
MHHARVTAWALCECAVREQVDGSIALTAESIDALCARINPDARRCAGTVSSNSELYCPPRRVGAAVRFSSKPSRFGARDGSLVEIVSWRSPQIQ